MKKYFIYLIILFVFISCTDQKNNKPVDNVDLKETLIRANQLMTQKENEDIDSYVKRYELQLEKTGTGLRYEILEKGNSDLIPQERDTVTVNYKINLIDGAAITDDSDTMKFIIGRAEMPKGLEEGLRMIGEGGKIFLIIPSHLAYGRSGDQSAIPGNATLVVNAELLNVKK